MAKKVGPKQDLAPVEPQAPVAQEEVIEPVKTEKKIVGASKAKSVEGSNPHGLAARDLEEVVINVTVPVHINGVRYEGKVKLPRHMAESIAEIVQKKHRADLEIFTGRNFIQHFKPNGDRIIQLKVDND